MSQPKDIHKYAQQCQLAYQDLKNIKLQTPAANFGGNRYQETNTNTNTSTSTSPKTAGQQTNCNEWPANFWYSRPFFVALNLAVATRPACSKATRLTREKIAKLQWEDQCFHCKEVGNHQPRCLKEWQLMTAITNTALALVNVSKVAVPQPGHVEAENAWPPQQLLWTVRSHYWSLPLVYQAICLPMRP